MAQAAGQAAALQRPTPRTSTPALTLAQPSEESEVEQANASNAYQHHKYVDKWDGYVGLCGQRGGAGLEAVRGATAAAAAEAAGAPARRPARAIPPHPGGVVQHADGAQEVVDRRSARPKEDKAWGVGRARGVGRVHPEAAAPVPPSPRPGPPSPHPTLPLCPPLAPNEIVSHTASKEPPSSALESMPQRLV